MSLVVSDFEGLARAITQAHEHLLTQATRAINVNLTLRNWLIGCYIYEYEQGGIDRATYGERLLDRLAERLTVNGLRNCSGRELRRYRQFYLTYPQIRESLPHESIQLLPGHLRDASIRGTLSPELTQSGVTLTANLSFSHLAELMQIDDPLKRAFYEIESLRGRWSVRELKRQIASLYYERSHLSRDRQKLAELARASADQATPAQIIRDPYVFEFLGLQPQEVMSESALENALLDKLYNFLLELGRGFCFEARQKRLLIGSEHFFVDLVFYHRILKCHILIELKVDSFSHEHLGQLNTYVNWFRVHEMAEDDNLPIGILLCTEKNHTLVEYALAGMDNRLFVSKYQLALPGKEEMRRFIEAQMAAELGGAAGPQQEGDAWA